MPLVQLGSPGLVLYLPTPYCLAAAAVLQLKDIGTFGASALQ